jgi:PAS domain S-box-containing protein
MSLRVLFVEDDAADMELALHQLRKAGLDFSASRVDTAEELSQSLKQLDFDVIVCDYRLPGWSGLDALSEASKHAPDTPILLLTGATGEQQVLACRRLGASELIYKDRLSLLPAALESAVANRRRLASSRLELEATQERFRSIFEQAPTGIAVASPEGRFLQVNPAFCRITGYPAAELLAMSWDDLLMPGAGPENLFRTLRATSEPAPALQTDAQFRHKNGTVLDVQWNLSPLRHAEGRPVGHIGQITDITRRKQAEMKLKQYAMVVDRSNQDLQHFAYVASHDLQEPLRMVKSYLELLTRRYRGKLDAEADEFIGFAVDGATRMQNLIQGLLAYSRIGTHGKPMQPVELDSVFASALANLEVAVNESSARIEKQPLPCVLGDVTQLTQLLQNLLANSLKFRSDQPPFIEVSCTREPMGWRFLVRDNGIGLDPAFSERIFQMFQRLHGPGKYPGSGIGLALCKRIVERHGGRLWVESQPGEGASFFFTLADRGENGE